MLLQLHPRRERERENSENRETLGGGQDTVAQERTIKLQGNLRLCEVGTEKCSRNGGHREECLGEGGT